MKTKIPAAEQAERLILACCLIGERELAETITHQLCVDDFHSLANREAFNLIVHLLDDRQPIDAVSFQLAWPKSISNPPEAPMEIVNAQDLVPSPENWPTYMQEVKDAALRRRAYAVGYQLAQNARNLKSNIGESITAATSELETNTNTSPEIISGSAAVNMLVDDLERRQQHQGRLSGISSGFNRLDRVTDGFQPQELSIIGARPSQGKSAILLSFAAQAAIQDKIPTLVLSLEMSIPAFLRRLTSSATRIPLAALKAGTLSQSDFAKLATFNAQLKAAPIFWFDGTSGCTANRLAGLVRYHVKKHGVRLVVVDYLQRIRPNTRHEKRTYEIADVSASLKALAVSLNIHVCCAAQLNREPDNGTKGPRPPRLSDLADSGQIERDADLVGLLHRPRTDEDPHGENAMLLIAKQRDGELGAIPLRFNGGLCRFEEGGMTE